MWIWANSGRWQRSLACYIPQGHQESDTTYQLNNNNVIPRGLFRGTSSVPGFPGGSVSKESACSGGDWVRSLGQEDPLEEGMATHSSTLAWRIPWIEEPGGLQSMGWHKVGYDWATEHISVPVLYWPVYTSSQNSGRVYRGLWIKSNAHKKKAWPLLSEAKVEGARARKITREHMKMRLAPYSPTRDVFADRPSQVHPASTSRIKRLENIQEALSLRRKVKHTRYLYQGLNPILSVVTPFLSRPVAAFTWNFIPLRARSLLCHLWG